MESVFHSGIDRPFSFISFISLIIPLLSHSSSNRQEPCHPDLSFPLCFMGSPLNFHVYCFKSPLMHTLISGSSPLLESHGTELVLGAPGVLSQDFPSLKTLSSYLSCCWGVGKTFDQTTISSFSSTNPMN